MPKNDFDELLSDATPSYFSPDVERGRRFFAGRRRRRSSGLHVVAAGVETVASHYSIHRERFAYNGIEFVAAGEGTLVLAGNTHLLKPGIVFCYGHRTPHQIVTHPKNRLVKYFVDFEGNTFARIARETGFGPSDVLQTSQPSSVMSIFDELVRAGLRSLKFSETVCAALLTALLYRISETAVSPESFHSSAFSTYAAIRSDLEEHALEIASLSELSERNSVAQAYLCRLFQRFDYESPYRKLQRLKMQHAAQRLQAGETLVKALSHEMGFSDPFHFSRSFKRVLGVSPSSLLKNRL